MAKEKSQTEAVAERPPVVVIVGHVDHGKSKLLDYIRKTKIVEGEAGGITQHLSAYEVVHTTSEGKETAITFLDTPGHEAFQSMRTRGAAVADVAVLVVSAEDGVKAQTLEARDAVVKAGIPYVVAITKIDKPEANVERVKQNLLEHSVFLEGLGGDIPFTPISSMTGEGVPELLDMIALVAELEELTGDRSLPAEGIVIEAHKDKKTGISATLIIKNGTLSSGAFVVAGDAYAPTRIMRDFQGKTLTEASFSSPVTLSGFSDLPTVGEIFTTVDSKKEAEKQAQENKKEGASEIPTFDTDDHIVPVLVKADTQGTLDAVLHEINKIPQDRVQIKIVSSGVGVIGESDVKLATGGSGALIVGFNTTVDASAQELARRAEVEIETFDIIYKLTEWLEEAVKVRTPKQEVKEKSGTAKVLKTFSSTKGKHIIGGRVNEGVIAVGDTVAIIRRDEEIGQGSVIGLQQQKAAVKSVSDGEFGAEVQSKWELAPGDQLESFTITLK